MNDDTTRAKNRNIIKKQNEISE